MHLLSIPVWKENTDGAEQCPALWPFSWHCIVSFGKREKQWAVTDSDIYTCQLAKVNIFICSHLRKTKCDMFRGDRHMGELHCKRQAKKNRDACKKAKKSAVWKFASFELAFFTSECQCLEHSVACTACPVLSGLEYGVGNNPGSAACFICSCVPEIIWNFIECLSSSHRLHTGNKFTGIQSGVEWDKIRLG